MSRNPWSRNRKTIKRITCIKDSSTLKFTEGKTYVLVDKLGDTYFVTNNEGNTVEVNRSLFV